MCAFGVWGSFRSPASLRCGSHPVINAGMWVVGLWGKSCSFRQEERRGLNKILQWIGTEFYKGGRGVHVCVVFPRRRILAPG